MSVKPEEEIVRALVPCDGTPLPAHWRDLGWSIQPIRSRGAARELNLHVDGLRQKVTGQLDRRANDLVRIAAYAFGADQLISRGGKGDPDRQRWRRELALAVPVADPDFWSDDVTTRALVDALGFGTDDRWSFAFVQAGSEDEQLWMDLHVDDWQQLAGPDCVALLSGGTDSLCAVVAAVAEQGMKPLLVNHRSAIHLQGPQRHLAEGLADRFADWTFPEMSFWVHLRNREAPERTRRTRGFLVAALGAAAAGQVGIPTVLLPDNGYVSVNPPVNAQLVGALNSRGTHPTFLRLVNDLLARVFPDGVRVENPLADLTRAEALRGLTAHGCAGLLAETRSCAKSRRPADTPHCGICSQCVDRRFATVAAGLEDHDSAERYEVDLFTDPLPLGEGKTFATSYVGFAQRVDVRGPEDLFWDYPQLELCLDPDAPAMAAQAERLADLLRRHSAEVLDALGVMISRYGGVIARRQLRDGCLLKLVTGLDLGATDESDGKESITVAHLEHGSVAELPVPAPDSRLTRNRIERQGRLAYVVFGDEKALVDITVGLRRLVPLLKWPHQEQEALSLEAGSSPSPDSMSAAVAQEGLRVTGPGRQGPRVDRRATRDYEARAAELRLQRGELEASGDEAALARIDADMEALTDEILLGKGKSGQGRSWSEEHERARTKIAKSVHSCIQGLARDMPELHAHLSRWVHTGYTCIYDPSPREHWDISL